MSTEDRSEDRTEDRTEERPENELEKGSAAAPGRDGDDIAEPPGESMGESMGESLGESSGEGSGVSWVDLAAGQRPPGLLGRAYGFIRNAGLLVCLDIVKLSHYWVIIAGYGAVVGIVTLGAYLTYYGEQAVAIRSNSGWAFAISLMARCVDLGIPIVYVMVCILFSIEVSNQTVKYILTRPVTRIELIVSKYVTAMLMFVLAISIFWAIALAAGHYYYGLGDLVENEYVIFKAGYMLREIAVGTLFIMIPCAAIAAMAVMVSTFSSTMGGSIIVGLIFWFFFQVLGIIPKSLGIGFTFGGEDYFIPYITIGFPSQRHLPIMVLDDLATGLRIETWWSWNVQSMAMICGAYFLLFFIISIVAVKRRDFTL